MTLLYKQRMLGSKPRVNEEITLQLWKGIISFLEKIEKKNFFSEEYPSFCKDYGNLVIGTDYHKLSQDIEIYTGLTWPLQSTKFTSEFFQEENYVPEKHDIFNLLELLYKKISKASTDDYHEYFKHHHLSFVKNNDVDIEYSKELNNLFAITGMIYTFNHSNGHIETILSDETQMLISNAMSVKIMDAQYDNMLKEACNSITRSNIKDAYNALKSLFYAYERLKCYFNPDNQSKKLESINCILKLFDPTPFQDLVREEMKSISQIGNTFLIRHSEPYQCELSNYRQIHYIFSRCLALIVLIQDQISFSKSNADI